MYGLFRHSQHIGATKAHHNGVAFPLDHQHRAFEFANSYDARADIKTIIGYGCVLGTVATLVFLGVASLLHHMP